MQIKFSIYFFYTRSIRMVDCKSVLADLHELGYSEIRYFSTPVKSKILSSEQYKTGGEILINSSISLAEYIQGKVPISTMKRCALSIPVLRRNSAASNVGNGVTGKYGQEVAPGG
jgi:hypothetical protein